MERAATLVRHNTILASDLAFLSADLPGGTDWLAGTLPEAVARLETAMIRHALADAAGNRARAAEHLGIRRQLLYQKLARYGLASPDRTGDVPEPDDCEDEPPVDSTP